MFGKMDDLITPSKWKVINNKMLYRLKCQSLPETKVERDAGVSFDRVWQLISSPVLTSGVQDLSYLLVHNKLPVPERLFRVGVRADLYCERCPGALTADIEHFFCSCEKVMDVWDWLKPMLVSLLGYDVSNEVLIRYKFPACENDKEIVWLIGNYTMKAWESIYVRGKGYLNGDEFYGFLKFKYKADQLGSRHTLRNIPGLS